MLQMCLWLMDPEDDIVFKLERIGSAVAPSKGIRIQDIREILAWENSRHLATLPLVFSPNDVWETRAEIPYWWRLGSASDWLNQISQAARPIRSTTQIWVVTRHQYGISALVSQTPFGGKTSGSVDKCRLFSQAREILACRIRNPGLWNLEYMLRNLEPLYRLESGVQVPLAKNKESSTWNP